MHSSKNQRHCRSIKSENLARGRWAVIEAIEPRLLMSSTWTMTNVIDFGGSMGNNPVGGLVADAAGNIYGITSLGGASSDGTIFKYNPLTHQSNTLAAFNSTVGTSPTGSLVIDSAGNLFGTTRAGGLHSSGTVFELPVNQSAIQVIADFDPAITGASATGGLVMNSAGDLFGMTSSAGANGDGTVFTIASGGNSINVLYAFTGTTDGRGSNSGMVLDSAGNLYGLTVAGGSNSNGSIFEIAASNQSFTTLASFDLLTTGASPNFADLAIDTSGNLFGTASTNDNSATGGTVFELVANSSSINVLATFDNSTGEIPNAGVVIDANGNLFGTTRSGADNTHGAVYEIPSGQSTVSVLSSFTTSSGFNNFGRLLMNPNGRIFGTATDGGGSTVGTLFQLLNTVTLSVGTGLTTTISNGGSGSAFNLQKAGEGRLILSSGVTLNFFGDTDLAEGTLQVDGDLQSQVTVDSGATLNGTGTVDGIKGNGGVISLSDASGDPSALTNTGLLIANTGSTLQEVIGQTSGNEVDGQLLMTGLPIYLTNLSLDVSLTNNFVPAMGDVITVISNQTGQAITGNFNGLAEGDVASFDGICYQASYLGGLSGNDMTLTVVPAAWTGTANGHWANAGNWQSGSVPAVGEDVTFPTSVLIVPIDLGGDVTVGNLVLNGSYAFTGGTMTAQGTVTSNSTGASISSLAIGQVTDIHIATSSNLAISGLAGTAAVNKTGAGTLVLPIGGTYTYTGTVEVSAGTLQVNATLGFGIKIDVGAEAIGSGSANGIIGAGGTISIGAQDNSGLTLVAASTINVASGNTLSFTQISGSYNLTKTGTGTLVFASGGSIGSASTNIAVSAGTLTVNTAIGNSITVNTGATVAGTGTAVGITAAGGTISLATASGSALVLSANTTIDVATGVTLSFSQITGSHNLTKTGAGTLVLTSIGIAYVGTTTLSTGTLEVDMALGSAITAASGTTLTGTGTANGISSAGATISLATATGTGLTLTGNSTLFVDAGHTLTYESITGNKAIVKSGLGTLVIPNAGIVGTYNKIIDVLAGTMQVDTAVTATVNVENNATLTGSGSAANIHAYGGTIMIAPTSGGSVYLHADSFIRVNSNNTLTLDALRSSGGNFGFTKTGTGKLVFSGLTSHFTYAGNTIVADGTLEVNVALQWAVYANAGNLTGTGSAHGIFGNGGTISLATQSGTALTVMANSIIDVDLGSTLSYDSVASSANITKTGLGTLVFPNGGMYSTFTGTIETAAGTLQVDDALQAGVVVDVGATIVGSGSANGIISNGGTVSLATQAASSLTLNANTTINIATGNTLTFDDISGSTFGITKTGAGTLVLDGQSINYTGATHVSGGTLEVDVALPSAVTVGIGATLLGSGTAAGITASGGTVSLATQSGTSLLVAASSTIFVDALGTLSFDTITGNANLAKSGAGTLVLAAGGSFNTYTGNMHVGGGTLQADGTLLANISLSSGATLLGSGTVGSIIGAGGTIAMSQNGNALTLTATGGVTLASSSTLNAYISSVSGTEVDGSLFADTGSTIDLGGATLALSVQNGFTPAIGHVISLLSSAAGNTLTGEFGNMPDGAVMRVGGANYQIVYNRGAQPSVSLTVVAAVWTGTNGDGEWNTADNWLGGVAPSTDQAVEFPAHSGAPTNIHLASVVTLGDLIFDGNYHLTGSAITLDGNITSNSPVVLLQNALLLTHNTTMTVSNTDGFFPYAIGDAGNHYGITKLGGGTLSLVQNCSYTGTTEVSAGTLKVNLTLSSPVLVDSGTTLINTTSFGQTAGITSVGGTIQLGADGYAGQFTVAGDVTLDSATTLQENIDGFGSNEDDGVLIANGASVNLNDAALDVELSGGFLPPLGHVITLISNQTGQHILGTFSGLPEGATATINGVEYQVSYTGNSADDVTLTVLARPAAVWTGNADDLWNNAGNWQDNVAPMAGQSVELPSHSGNVTQIFLSTDVAIGDLAFNGDYIISSHAIHVADTISASSTNSSIDSDLIFDVSATVSVDSSDSLTFQNIIGTHSFTKTGTGLLQLVDEISTAATTVNAGTLEVDGTSSSPVIINTGGTLQGSGTVAGITANGGTVLLSNQFDPAILSNDTNRITFTRSSALREVIGESNSAEIDGELISQTSVNLNGASLDLTALNGFAPAVGHVITLIHNLGGNVVAGTFDHLPEGAITSFNSVNYQISYQGGITNQDVTLTVVDAPQISGFQFVRQPANSMSGQDLGTITVYAVDANGHLLTDTNLTLSLFASDNANIIGTTFASSVHGIATFTGLSIKQLGVYHLTVVTGPYSGVSDQFSITPRRIIQDRFDGGTGSQPQGGMAVDAQGNLYGTTRNGGDWSDGTVFKYDSFTGAITTLASFDSNNGNTPMGSVLIDSNGNLFGTARNGGHGACGTVWELPANSGTIIALASFDLSNTGASPETGLVIDASGNLFGTTSGAGPGGKGTAFEIVHNSGIITVLHSFDSGTDGGTPNSAMVMDAAGNLFGATYDGGSSNNGSIFEISFGTHTFSVLAELDGHDFGSSPWGSDLAIDPAGNLFLTANTGDNNTPDGALLELVQGSNTLTTLAIFDFATTGAAPRAGVVIDEAGNLFGTTTTGGADNNGTVYEFPAGGSAITVLMSLNSNTGYDNYGRLVIDSNGRLYGSASSGGTDNVGTVFEYTVVPVATHLVITSQPTSVLAGAPQTFIVNVESADGVTIDYSGTVGFGASTKPGGGHTGGASSAIAINGVATFTGVTFDVAGRYVLGFSTGSLTDATSADIHVVVPTWTGAGSDNLWSNPANWQNSIVGTGSSFADFPNLTSSVTNIVVDQPEVLSKISFEGRYNITGQALGISDNIEANSPGVQIDNITLLYDVAMRVGTNDSLTLNTVDDLGTNCVTFKEGDGTLILSGTGLKRFLLTYINGGTMQVDGTTLADIYVQPGTTLSGSGTVHSITGNGGTISLSSNGAASHLSSTGNVSIGSGSTLVENLSSTSGTENDGQLIASGSSIDLTGSTFDVSLLGGFTPAPGDVITLISNQTGSAVTGTFTNLAQGSLKTINNVVYVVSYTGGSSHHNVTITVIQAPTITSGSTATFAAGQADTFTITTVAGPTATITKTGTLPTGLTFLDNGNGTATISGTPTTIGNYSVTITAANGTGSNATQTLTFHVNAPLAVTNLTEVHINGELTLREALALAVDGGYIIDVPAGIIHLTQGVLTANDIGHTLTIRHTGSGTATIDGQAQSTDLKILANTTLNITGMILTGGQANQGANSLSGGAIQNAGTLTLNNSILIGNMASFAGGAIANTMGVLTLNNTLIRNNSAGTFGGGGIANNQGTVTINNSTFDHNQSDSSAGAILNYAGSITIVNSTFNANSALTTGGIYNSTAATLSMTDCTMTASSHGGIFNDTGTASLNGVIVANTVSGSDLGGIFTGSYDLIADASGTGLTSARSGAALITPLGFYGGITPTIALLHGSPALGNGHVFVAANNLDQRGHARNVSSPNIGAFEGGGLDVTITSSAPSALTAGQSVNFIITTGSLLTAALTETGTLPAGLTFTDNNDGTASLTGVPTLAGSFSITFNANNNAGADANQPITLVVNAGSATHLGFSQQPTTSVVAGVSLGTVIVQLLDANGNVAIGDSSSITLAPSGSTLNGTLTVTTNQGVATFGNLSMNIAGAFTLHATDGNLIAANSSSFNITAAGATQLVINQQPTNAAAHQTIGSVIVDVEDAYGNIVTTDGSLVTIAPGSSTLNGTATATAVSGVATFSGLSIDRAGTYTLLVTDGGLGSTTSSAFSVSAAAAFKLVVAQQPNSTTTGLAVGTIVFDVEDAFNNIVLSDSSTVTLTATDGAPLGGSTSAAAVGGVATFTNLSIGQLGTHTLIAADGDLISATTNEITVTPVLSNIAITSPPTAVAQGATVQLIVTGTDQFGSPMALGEVTWSLDSGLAGSVDQTGSFTAGNTAGNAVIRATSDGQTAIVAVTVAANIVPPTFTAPAYAVPVSVKSPTTTLHVQVDPNGENGALTYTWEIINQPGAVSVQGGLGAQPTEPAPLAIFSVNGTHAASDTTVTFLAVGEFTFRVTASDGTTSVSSDVQATAGAKVSPVAATTAMVSGVSPVSDGHTITGFVISFNRALDPVTAQDIRGYRVLRRAGFSAYRIASAVYDSQTSSVTLTLSSPMPVRNGVRLVRVLGSGQHAVRNANGDVVNGDANGTAGGNFTYRFIIQTGKSLVYRTAHGDVVKLTLKGPGQIAMMLSPATANPMIYLRNIDPASSILTGKVRKGRGTLGYVVIDQLNGVSSVSNQLGEEFHVNAYGQ